MPASFPILRTISAKGSRAMITVKFGKQTVTRHIVNGEGRHPDDTLPKRYDNLTKAIHSLQEDIHKVNKALAAIDEEIATNGPEADSARTSRPNYAIIKVVAETALLEATERYQTELAENPLVVSYRSE